MSLATSNTGPFASAWEDFWALGYSPIPLRGKRPTFDDWSRFCTTRADYMQAAAWAKSPSAGDNIGLCMGLPIGEHILVAIDIDMRDHDDVEDIVSTLPAGGIRKKGEKGLTIIYRAKPGDVSTRAYKGKKQGGKRPTLLDMLATGRQTVMPPSIHPDINQPYAYVDGSTLVKPEELPILTDDHIIEMEEMLETKGWDRRYSEDEKRGHIRVVADGGELVAGSMESINRMALDNIPAWVEELNLFRGRWRGARFEAVNMMRESSTGKDPAKRKRNLKIHPNGIRDFGSDDTWSPIDLVAEVMEISPDEAYTWLATRVDPNWERLNALDVDALVASANARKRPKKEPEKPQERETEDDAGQTLDIKVKRAMGPLPASAYDTAPGLIGRVAREVMASSPRMPKTVALMTAISTVSALAGRRWLGETRGGNLHLTIYAVAMSSTGGGKDAAINFGSRLLRAMAKQAGTVGLVFDYGTPIDRASMKHEGPLPVSEATPSVSAFTLMNAGADFTSDSGFITGLWQCGMPWVRVDEFGSVFGGWTVRHTTGAQSVTTLLRKYYSKAAPQVGKQYALNQSVSKELHAMRNKELVAPAVTLFGVTTPAQMYDALDNSMSEDGTINRFIIAEENADAPTMDDTFEDLFGDTVRSEINPEIVQECIDLFMDGMLVGNDDAGNGVSKSKNVNQVDDRLDVFADPSYRVVRAKDDAVRRAMAEFIQSRKERIYELEKTGDEVAGFMANVIARVGENFLRLAYLAAVADKRTGEPAVTTEHVVWAQLIMKAVEGNLISLVSEHMKTTQDRTAVQAEKRLTKNAQKLIGRKKSGKLASQNAVLDGGWVAVKSLINESNSTQRRSDRQFLDVLASRGDVQVESIKPPSGAPGQKDLLYVRFNSLLNSSAQ